MTVVVKPGVGSAEFDGLPQGKLIYADLSVLANGEKLFSGSVTTQGPPAEESLLTGPSLDLRSLEVRHPLPVGCAGITVARCIDPKDDTLTEYAHEGIDFVDAVGTKTHPYVAMVAVDKTGATIGHWSQRFLTMPGEPIVPPVIPAPTGTIIGCVLRDTSAAVVGRALAQGAKFARFEIQEWTPQAAELCTRLHAAGVTPQVLVTYPYVGNVDWPKIATLAGIKLIELDNEGDYQYKNGEPTSAKYHAAARALALEAKRVAQILAAYGIGLIIPADDGGTGSSAWVDEMFAAVPDLAKYVAGWSAHLYSNAKNAKGTDSYGRPKLERMLVQLAKHLETSLPIYCTEWGFASVNGEKLSSEETFTYLELAEYAPKHLAQLVAAGKGRLAQVMVYQSEDQKAHGNGTNREYYFGVEEAGGKAKGAYTPYIEGIFRKSPSSYAVRVAA